MLKWVWWPLKSFSLNYSETHSDIFMKIGTNIKHIKECAENKDCNSTSKRNLGWSDGAMVLGKLPVPGRPTILITVGHGPIALAVGAGGGGLDIFTLIYLFSSFSLSLGDGPI